MTLIDIKTKLIIHADKYELVINYKIKLSMIGCVLRSTFKKGLILFHKQLLQ